MRLLIDTFNVLHVTGVLPPGLAGPGVHGLAALIHGSRWADTPVALICDGMPPSKASYRLPGKIRAIYSRQLEADDVLERLIADSSTPSRLLVVSSDRRVRKAARRRGATDLKAEAFLRMLLEDRSRARLKPMKSTRPANLRPGEIESWREEFKIGENDSASAPVEFPPHLLDSLREMETSQKPLEPPRSANKRPIAGPEALIPEDLLKEAQEILESSDETTHQMIDRIQDDESDPHEANLRPSDASLDTSSQDIPQHLIDEAEAMLRNWGNRDMQDKPD